MFIQSAQAQTTNPTGTATTAATTTPGSAPLPPPPSGTEMLLWNAGFIAVMVVMFYLLLIRPQQNRYKEHAALLKTLKKGDKVVLQSGMIATVDHVNDNQEMTVDLGSGQKVHIFRSAIAGKYEDYAKK